MWRKLGGWFRRLGGGRIAEIAAEGGRDGDTLEVPLVGNPGAEKTAGAACRLFSQEHYDRLMAVQRPWIEFHASWSQSGDAWEGFFARDAGTGKDIQQALNNWNRAPDEQRSGAKLQGADLGYARLSAVSLRSAYLGGAWLYKTQMVGADLTGAQLEEARLLDADLRGACLAQANMKGAYLSEAYLQGADLTAADLDGASLAGAHLAGAKFDRAFVSGETDLTLVDFGPRHPAMHDGSDTIRFPRRDRLNWGILRRVGTLPLFEISYVALAASLITITSLGYLNRTEFLAAIDYPIPLPGRMMWLLLSSVFLVLGTTIYRLKCPPRVQEFSETQWVEQHGHPRLQYLAESLKRRWQMSTAVFTVLGGALGLALFLERLWVAFRYVLQELLR